MLGSTINSRMSSSELPTLKCKLAIPKQSTHATNRHWSRYYKALTFYLQEQPTLLTELLSVLIPRINHSRVVKMFDQIEHLPLIRSYLIAVQHVSLEWMPWF